jgi:hypothetical protein
MKKVFPLFVITILLLIGCSKEKPDTTTEKNTQTSPAPIPSGSTDKPNANTSLEEKQKTEDSKEPEKKENVRDKDGGIIVKFPAGSTQVTLNGKINGFGEHITYVVDAQKGQKLFANVMATAMDANIRISQIISPSGNADGPFGPKTNYDLNESGNWKIVLSENQMAGDAWKGEYQLLISIK